MEIYGFVDSHREAQRQMVKQLAGNLMTVAKDVKIQVEFNPQKIREYRLLGYENRRHGSCGFQQRQERCGEIGAGHRVTALYEVALVGSPEPKPAVENLRYQPAVSAKAAEVPACQSASSCRGRSSKQRTVGSEAALQAARSQRKRVAGLSAGGQEDGVRRS